LAHNTSIVRLGLRRNRISTEGCAELVKSLQKNNTIVRLDVSQNVIYTAAAPHIASMYRVFAILILWPNIVFETHIIEIIATNRTITDINLNVNKLGAEGATVIGVGLNNAAATSPLRKLRLSNNKMGSDVGVYIYLFPSPLLMKPMTCFNRHYYVPSPHINH
jgi:hypothetical protein